MSSQKSLHLWDCKDMVTGWRYWFRRYLGWFPYQPCIACSRWYWGGFPKPAFRNTALRNATTMPNYGDEVVRIVIIYTSHNYMKTLIFLLVVALGVAQPIPPSVPVQTPSVLFSPVIHWGNIEGWTVQISGGSPSEIISRQSILLTAPGLRAYPNNLAQDVITRQAAKSPSSWVGPAWNVVAPAGSAYLTTSGIIKKKNAETYAGAGLGLLQFLVALWSKQAPNVTPYFSNLLPDRVVLDQTGSGEWDLVTGWDKSTPSPKAVGPYPIQR